jgi:hypothetical protein
LEVIYRERVRQVDFDSESQTFENVHFSGKDAVEVKLCFLCEEAWEGLLQDVEEDPDYVLWIALCFGEFTREEEGGSDGILRECIAT